jgi:hypothetical protein
LRQQIEEKIIMEHGISLSTFKDILAVHCCWTPDAVNSYLFQATLNEAFQSIDSLRLDQIKRVIKDMKNLGYYTLQLTGNKAFFVQSLFRVLQEYRVPASTTRPVNPQSNVPIINSAGPGLPYGSTASYHPRHSPAAPAPTLTTPTPAPSYAPHAGKAYNNHKSANNYAVKPPIAAPVSYHNYGAQPQYAPVSASKFNPGIPQSATNQMRSPSSSNAASQHHPNASNGFHPQAAYQVSSSAPHPVTTNHTNIHNNHNTAAGNKVTPAPKPVKLSDRNLILNTREKYEVFYKLSVISGITKEEILREIQVCPESELSEDYILYQLISRKDPEAVSHDAHHIYSQ